MTDFVKLILVVALIALGVFIAPALLVWGLGCIFQGEGFDLNFWSWLGAFVVLLVLKGELAVNRS